MQCLACNLVGPESKEWLHPEGSFDGTSRPALKIFEFVLSRRQATANGSFALGVATNIARPACCIFCQRKVFEAVRFDMGHSQPKVAFLLFAQESGCKGGAG
jgi:hypothetical protein